MHFISLQKELQLRLYSVCKRRKQPSSSWQSYADQRLYAATHVFLRLILQFARDIRLAAFGPSVVSLFAASINANFEIENIYRGI